MTLTRGAQASKIVYDSFGNPTTSTPFGTAADGGLFNTPRGVAVNVTGTGGAGAGDVYVVNGGSNRIDQFGAKGNFIRAFGRDVIETGKANDNATAYEICDTTAGNVAADCKVGVTTPAEGGTLSSPQGIAVDQTTGNLYVTNQSLNRVEVFDATGHVIRAFGQDVVSAGPGNNPAAAAKQTLTIDAAEGQFKLSFRGQTTADIAFNATAAQVDTALEALGTVGVGNVAVTGGPGGVGGVTPYVVTFSGALNNAPMPMIATAAGTTPLAGGAGASIISTTTGSSGYEICNAPADTCKAGVSAAAAGALLSSFSGGYLAVAPAGAPNAGNVIVTDPGNRRVNEYTPAGAFVRSFGFDVTLSPPNATTTFEICSAAAFDVCKVAAASGSGIGQFGTNGPSRVAVDSTGAIYTVEQANPNFRLQKFTPAGANLTPALFNPPIGVTPTVFLSGTSTTNTPTEVAIGASNRVFVAKVCVAASNCPNAATASERRIYEFDSSGSLLDTHIAGAGITLGNGFAVNPLSDRVYYSVSPPEFVIDFHRVYIIANPPGQPPTVTTGPLGAAAADHLATLTGIVNPAGFKVSDCHFEYGLTPEYGETTPCLPSAAGLGDGVDDVAVSASTEPLQPNSVYHYRLFGSNLGATGQGKDRTFTTGPAPADGCANAGIRAEQGIDALLLPDCMALEMVSTPRKLQQFARDPNVSLDGGRILFSSIATLGDTPGRVNPFGDPYVATRTASGWQTASTTPPPQIGHVCSPLCSSVLARGFAPDFSRWFHMGAGPDDAALGIWQGFRGELGAGSSPLSAPMVPNAGNKGENAVIGGSADFSHVLIMPENGTPTNSYLPGDPVPAGTGADRNVYVGSRDASNQPSLELLARDGDGNVWGGRCGVTLGGSFVTGTISHDGSRVYFTTRPSQPASGNCNDANKKRILVRVETPNGPEVDELIDDECDRQAPDPLCSSPASDDTFQGGSVDQTKVYFTTNRQLASSDLDSTADLYLYDATLPLGGRLTQVSAGEVTATHPVVGSGAAVSAVKALSSDGSHAYFTSAAALTDDSNPEGKKALSGQPNLYVYDADSGILAFLVTAGDVGSTYPVPLVGTDGKGNEVGGDGHILLFTSKAQLTGDDTDGSLDIYRYDDESGTLARISKAAPGGSDNGDKGVSMASPPASLASYEVRGRWASEAGDTIAFSTAEPLLPGDVNGVSDAYVWRRGELFRLPGSATPVGVFSTNPEPTLSPDGDTIAYASPVRLLPADGDGVQDVYVARVNGGFQPPPSPPNCVEEACQGAPPAMQGEIGAASSSFIGPGNVSQNAPKPKCPKGKVRRHGKCVKKHPKKQHRKASPRRAAAQSRGGSR